MSSVSALVRREVRFSAPSESRCCGESAPGHSGPLAGLRVIDCTHMLAGPYCTWVLGGLGADVIKVEKPARGDFTRGVAPFLDGQRIYFMSVNRNKRGVTLDLKTEPGKGLFRRR